MAKGRSKKIILESEVAQAQLMAEANQIREGAKLKFE